LMHLPQAARISLGDRIITSGHGGAFPSGLPIGIISAMGDDGIDVKFYTDFSRLEYVRIVDFGLNDLIKSNDDKNVIIPIFNAKTAGK